MLAGKGLNVLSVYSSSELPFKNSLRMERSPFLRVRMFAHFAIIIAQREWTSRAVKNKVSMHDGACGENRMPGVVLVDAMEAIRGKCNVLDRLKKTPRWNFMMSP